MIATFAGIGSMSDSGTVTSGTLILKVHALNRIAVNRTNIKCFNTDVYIESISNINEVKLPKGYIDWKPNTKVFKSSSIFGKDLYSEKYIYILFRYIAHTLLRQHYVSSRIYNKS